MKKKIVMSAIALTVAFVLSACQATDVVSKLAVNSFDAVTNKLGDKVAFDQKYNAWALTLPTGERFLIAKDFTGSADTIQEFDAKPFLDAGLDPAKLPAEVFEYDQASNKLLVIGEIGSEQFNYSGEAKVSDTFKEIVRTNRDAVGYHAKLDHYGIVMGNGNMFEWAKDMNTNDKDVVFVLNPEPFINAGVDPSKVDGWAFAKVEVMDEQGKPMEVDKLLRPFELD
ncbi:MAG TPA: hypothetical protein VEF53_02665 [Patescibacteria group bacterium]|nr:hypothetical protein [Patescibacteria group bacterium]